MVFEERMDQLRRKDTDVKMLSDQVAILKVALGKLEIDNGRIGIDGRSDSKIEDKVETGDGDYDYDEIMPEESLLTSQLEQLQMARSELQELNAVAKSKKVGVEFCSRKGGMLTSVEREKEER